MQVLYSLRRGGGHEGVLKAFFWASAYTLQAADAVGMAHKIRVGYIYIHGAFARALTTAPAYCRVAANAEYAQYAQ